MAPPAPAPRVLRVGVIHDERIIEERHVRRREPVTVGTDAGNTLVLPAPELPPSFALFEVRGEGYQLVFDADMQGRVHLGGSGPGAGDVELAALRQGGGAAQRRGEHWVLPLPDTARGTVRLGGLALLFQFVPPLPPAFPDGLPRELRGGFWRAADGWFWGAMGGAVALAALLALVIALQERPREPELALEDLPDRFARVLLPPEPPPAAPAPAAPDATGPAAPKAARAEAEPARPAAPRDAAARREAVVAQVQGKGLLKVLGSAAREGGAFADVLGAGGTQDVAAALAGAGAGAQVGLASATREGAPARAGGTGAVAAVGEVGTRGGGRVELAPKREVAELGRAADGAPTIEGADAGEVDREALARYVRARLRSIQGCYERELKREPALRGKVVVRFDIQPSGRPANVAVDDASLGSDAVASCIRTVVRGWAFPFKPSADVPVSYPIVFTPAG